MKWFILMPFWLLLTVVKCEQNDDEGLEVVSKSRTTFLDKYQGYVDVVVVHLEVPKDRPFASFKFIADELQNSIFGCSPRKISLYMKYGSLPVINPDNSKFPDTFKNISRSELFELEFMSDKKPQYLNLTSPEPGSYYISTFLSYSDPKHESIKPGGLSPQCFAFIDVTLYASKSPNFDDILNDNDYYVEMTPNSSSYYKFYVPMAVDEGVLTIDSSTNDVTLTVRIQDGSIPSANKSQTEVITGGLTTIIFETQENRWHFIEFSMKNDSATTNLTFKFRVKFVKNLGEGATNAPPDYDIYGDAISKIHQSEVMSKVGRYKQYDLIRESSTESFSYSYDVRKKIEMSSPVAINVTSAEFVTLKFQLRDNTDIGGTLQFIMAFKPRLSKSDRSVMQEPAGHKIVGCIRSELLEVPTWPNLCVNGDERSESNLILNSTVGNTTLEVPFPESGTWYASFKLFCDDKCEKCDCSAKCQQEFNVCLFDCLNQCNDSLVCNECGMSCKAETSAKIGCGKCNCDGDCLIDGATCNTSVIFDLSSNPCGGEGCGRNGRCMFMVSDGIVYSTCVCSNNYRGWDCSDGSQATSYAMLVLELLLLVLSNLMFLPTVFVAFRRRYYVESLVYLSICFFSTFYHACDAGENIISFCMTRLAALQFADFFCALLSIWVTLIAIANLPSFYPSLCHTLGAIVLAFITTINKTSVWVFAVPAISGVLIIALSWYLKYRTVKPMSIQKRYLYVYVPSGVVVVTLGLIIFALLQTTENYKYLHSLWHILMAVAVIILLPRPDTFQSQTML